MKCPYCGSIVRVPNNFVPLWNYEDIGKSIKTLKTVDQLIKEIDQKGEIIIENGKLNL